MAVNFVKKSIAKMAGVLEPEYPDWIERAKALRKQELDPLNPLDSPEIEELEKLEDMLDDLEDMALAALEAAQEVIAERAKYTVVGQVKEPGGNGDKVALGWYPTEKQATSDALSLAYSTQTHEEARAWVLPVHHSTPHSWYKARKSAQVAEGETLNHRQAELKMRQQWLEAHEDEPIPLDWSVEVVTEIDTDECPHCYGLGRIPGDHIKRREEVPEHLRSQRASEVSNY